MWIAGFQLSAELYARYFQITRSQFEINTLVNTQNVTLNFHWKEQNTLCIPAALLVLIMESVFVWNGKRNSLVQPFFKIKDYRKAISPLMSLGFKIDFPKRVKHDFEKNKKNCIKRVF